LNAYHIKIEYESGSRFKNGWNEQRTLAIPQGDVNARHEQIGAGKFSMHTGLELGNQVSISVDHACFFAVESVVVLPIGKQVNF
jgi:hypothetical protein